MKTYIALFRAINVAGNKQLPMKDLVCLLENLGLQNIKTYIQSGNAVFDSTRSDVAVLARSIAAAIAAIHGFSPHVLLLKSIELDKAIDANPYPDAENDPATLHITFLSAVPKSPDLRALASIKKDSERFTLKGKLFYLHAPEGMGRSKLAARIEKTLGVPGTARNWRAVCKLAELSR